MSGYPEHVKTFDHTALAALPAYPALRQALNDIAEQADMPLDEFLGAVRDMATTTPHADCCPDCRTVAAWPHKVNNTDGWLQCHYRCPNCPRAWTCGYSVGFPGLFNQL